MKKIQNIADSHGVTLVKINSSVELQNYINSKQTDQWELSATRTSDKITKFTLFAHGLPGSIELGYGQVNQDKLSLDIGWIAGIHSSAFDNPNSAFYACRTGTTSDSGMNFAQSWVNMTGGKTWAAVGRTTYAYMNKGEGWMRKLNRKMNGFNTNGSLNYPIASIDENAYFQMFE